MRELYNLAKLGDIDRLGAALSQYRTAYRQLIEPLMLGKSAGKCQTMKDTGFDAKGAERRASGGGAAAGNGCILIVDDNPTHLEAVHLSLRTAGYRVLIAEDGRTACERAELAQPDLILLNVMMPGMDGFKTCRGLKQTPVTQVKWLRLVGHLVTK